MKITPSLHKIFRSALLLFAFLLGTSQPAQPAQAAPDACTLEYFHAGLITADETWCTGGDNTHYLTNDVTVQAGVTLTIAAGVTVDSVSDAWSKYLIVRGHLDINGTPAQPVLLTRSVNYPIQNWSGLYFDGTYGDGSGTINDAIIEHAGSYFLPPDCTGTCGTARTAVFVKDLAPGKQVTINHSTLRDNTSQGLYVVNSTVSVTNTAFNHNNYPVVIDGASSFATYSGNTFSDNAYPYYDNVQYNVQEDSIFIGQGALLAHDLSLPAQSGLDAYVFLAGTTVPAGRSLTVQPGVTLRTGNGQISVRGQLNAVGTPTLPVTLSGIPGVGTNTLEWDGLIFDGRDGGGTGHLDYATVASAADNLTEFGPYALLVRDTPVGGQVLVEHSTIRDNRGYGLRVINGKLVLNNSLLANNTWPIQVEGAASQVPLTGNTFSDNVNNTVYIGPAAMTDHDIDLTLQSGLDAYFFTDTFTLPSGRSLIVQPGVVVRTAVSKFLVIQGDLQAIGTSAQPIKFSSSTVPNTRWGGLVFDGPSGASGQLDHAIVENGCGPWNGQGCANLTIYNLAGNKSVVIEHSILQDSSDIVLSVINSPTARVDDNWVKGGRIGLYLGTNLTVRNLAVTDQILDGIIVENGYQLDGRHLTIARTGRTGLAIRPNGVGNLRNSILSQNALAVSAEGSGQVTLDTNLLDGNTILTNGPVSMQNSYSGSARFETDGVHIQVNSDATGKGLVGLCTTDMDGDQRPLVLGSLPDLGADEVMGFYGLFIPAILR